MQVHYNLLNGEQPDISAMQLRLAPGNADLTPLETMLLPAPVELPCRPGHDDNPLCDRDAAVADVKARFGSGPGLHQRRPLLPVRRQGEAEPDLDAARATSRADHHPRGRRPHAPARPVDQDRGQPGHPAGRDDPGHPDLGLRQPGRDPDPADPPRPLRHAQGDLHAQAVAARRPAVVRDPARGPLRHLGRGLHRRDVPRASSPSRTPEPRPGARQIVGAAARRRPCSAPWPSTCTT